jgi:hypothetical protein
MNSGFSIFILDIEPFFHEVVRGPDTVALMRSIGHRQIKGGVRGRPVAHFPNSRTRGYAIGWAGRRPDFCSGPTTRRSSNTDLAAGWATKR